jgi:hypothetical protein
MYYSFKNHFIITFQSTSHNFSFLWDFQLPSWKKKNQPNSIKFTRFINNFYTRRYTYLVLKSRILHQIKLLLQIFAIEISDSYYGDLALGYQPKHKNISWGFFSFLRLFHANTSRTLAIQYMPCSSPVILLLIHHLQYHYHRKLRYICGINLR